MSSRREHRRRPRGRRACRRAGGDAGGGVPRRSPSSAGCSRTPVAAAPAAAVFALEARHVALPHGASWHTAGERGAALLLPPGHWRLPLHLQALHGPAYVRAFGTALPRALGVLAAMERRHPREPHWYVAFVGVVPAAQRQGSGPRCCGRPWSAAIAKGCPPTSRRPAPPRRASTSGSGSAATRRSRRSAAPRSG